MCLPNGPSDAVQRVRSSLSRTLALNRRNNMHEIHFWVWYQ